jgi:hypothetical protein
MTPRHAATDESPDDRSDWWATLDDDALRDETKTNRRRERWLLLAAPLAMAGAAAVLVLHGGPTAS